MDSLTTPAVCRLARFLGLRSSKLDSTRFKGRNSFPYIGFAASEDADTDCPCGCAGEACATVNGRPQWMHDAAASEIFLPQSGHVINGMAIHLNMNSCSNPADRYSSWLGGRFGLMCHTVNERPHPLTPGGHGEFLHPTTPVYPWHRSTSSGS